MKITAVVIVSLLGGPTVQHQPSLCVVGERGGGGEEGGEGSLQYLLATDSGQLQVFQDSALKWAAALPHPPTDISVATFQ